MSAPAETTPAPAPVEEVKPAETPAAEPAPAPAAEEPKAEETTAPATEAPAEEAKPEVRMRFICLVASFHPDARLLPTLGACRCCHFRNPCRGGDPRSRPC